MVDDDLLALLHDDDAAIRTRAVQALGRIGDASSSDAVVAALQDDDPRVREKAAIAVGLLGARGARVDPPLDLLADPDAGVRGGVADALGLLRDDRRSDQLLTLLEDADTTVVARACYAVPRLERPGFAVERLLALSGRSEPEVLYACTWALSQLAADARRLDRRSREPVRRHMIDLTRSQNPWVRRLAVSGLFLPTRDEEAATVGELIEDRDYGVRIAAVGAITFPSAPLEPFISKALADEDDRVYLAVVQGLGRMRGDEIAEALARIVVHDERPWAREQAVISLGLASNLSAQMANGLSRAAEVPIRRATAGVLLGRIDDETIEYARRLYEDADPTVRAAAIPALAETGEPLTEILAGALDSDDPAIRAAVARAAGRRLDRTDAGGAEWTEALSVLQRTWQAARDESDPATALDVIAAAARLGGRPAGRQILEQGLSFQDWYVRRLAAAHLERVHGRRARADILPAVDLPIEHYEEIARWAAEPRAAVVTVQRPGFVPGRFTVRLDVESTPMAAWSFARLAAEGRYANRPIDNVVPDLALYVAGPGSRGTGGPLGTLRDEIRSVHFFPGTLGFSSPGPDGSDGSWFVTLGGHPELMTRYTAFGQVVQNFPGVVARLLPGDQVLSVVVYAGDGTEPLPPLEP